MRRHGALDNVLPQSVRQPFPEEKMKRKRTKNRSNPSMEMMSQKPKLDPIPEREQTASGKIRREPSVQLEESLLPRPDKPIY